jgi:hypothetical protein
VTSVSDNHIVRYLRGSSQYDKHLSKHTYLSHQDVHLYSYRDLDDGPYKTRHTYLVVGWPTSKDLSEHLRFQVLTAANLKVTVLWVVTLCGVVIRGFSV